MKWEGSDTEDDESASPPSQGAWIEIPKPLWAHPRESVAPLAGGVD